MSLIDQVPTEKDAYLLLEELRWGDKPVCPHCGSDERAYFLNPENGRSRRTRTGTMSERRVWKCAACRKQFSVLTHTVFHGSKVPLRTWLSVIDEMCANGISARDIERKYEVSAKTAWLVTERIRNAMTLLPSTLSDVEYAATFEYPLDPGIVRVVRVLRDAHVETFESCEGGPGHAYPEPTVRFHGGKSEGWRALAVVLQVGLPVLAVRRTWPVDDGEPTGPWWELVLRSG